MLRVSYPILLLLALSACDQHGGVGTVNGKELLSSFDGPKIQTIEETKLEAARNAETKNDYAQASQIYQQMLEKDPNNEHLIQALGYALRRNGEFDKAITIYDNLISKDINNIAAKEGKALALLSKGDFETPVELFQDVIKADPTRWKSLNGLGILFVTRALYPESTQYFDEALRRNPNNISIMNNLGLSLALNKQFENAIVSLSRASAQSVIGSEERKRIDLNLALVNASAGRLDEAKKIAEIYLNGPALKNNLGLYAHLAKNDALAKSYLNMALTESKVYYSKAWDNLETINNTESARKVGKTLAKAAPVEAVEQNSITESADKPKASAKSQAQNKKQPQNEKSSLGDIISTEIRKETSGAKTTIITPANNSNAVGSLEKSLGTIKANKIAPNHPDVISPSNPPTAAAPSAAAPVTPAPSTPTTGK